MLYHIFYLYFLFHQSAELQPEGLGKFPAKPERTLKLFLKMMQTAKTMQQLMKYIEPFLNRLRKLRPELPIELVDERFTSVLAHQVILDSGVGKQRRREDKGMVDEISATIILQQWMENRSMPGYLPKMF